MKATNGAYRVQPIDETAHNIIVCNLRGNLKKNLTYNLSLSVSRKVIKAKRGHTYDTVSIGDRVLFSPGNDDTGIIEEVKPRVTEFTRAGFRGMVQTMVSNLDQLVIVFACAEPNPDLWRIDKWLAAAEAGGLSVLLVANKCELVDDATFRERFAEYIKIGYEVIPVSAHAAIGIDDLRNHLANKISAFSGPSGVGKSSLLNAIQPGMQLATGEIGNVTFKGKHTTTVRELLPLDCGGWVADTPGLRQLELLKMDRDDLQECFIEFAKFLEMGCKFKDCMHTKEPGCALKKAVEEGHISRRRYDSFLAMAG